MSERIFIGVAWPYANGSLHLGQIAGCYLPADIFARYHRVKGNEVLMVSGSDQHGTPITLKAEQEGKNPAEITDFYQAEFLDCWQKLGITFNLFTTTGTRNHAEVAQDIFLKLLQKGYLYKNTVSQLFCPKCRRFLPDRYVEGTCPSCNSSGARGDQCDACGKPLNPTELIDPHCRICGTTPVLKESEHFFLKLSAFQDRLKKWVTEQSQWRPNVSGLTTRYLKEGLRDRAITRDIEWGVPVPVKGFEDKRIYVWFEAVIGYLSASKEWAKEKAKDEEKWHDFWDENKEIKSYYFIGKDNIPFHTLIWPAMLLGYEGLVLPHDVPANEFLTIEGRKLSTSKNWAVWLPDYLSRYDPDPLRYLLSINMPETSDTDFSWRELVRRNNDELVAAYGNLVNRVLTFVYRNFDGCVPEPGELSDADKSLMKNTDSCLEQAGEFLSRCSFKQAIMTAMSAAREANRYLDDKAPWKVIKEDRQAAATSLYVALSIISQLKTMFYPFLPFSSQKVHEYLGFDGRVEDCGWQPQTLPPGQKLREPKPLFAKLDDSIIDEETRRIGT
ncbi:MAG: methionine--tRNA ligase [Dehalococcoidales bacterium]|nr:methionine--tRNA ligase [Dehalococcoidales bacterium]